MRFKQLRLQNIRSYADQTVEFPKGTIFIHGENGAGKTSLLMGMFGGLYLSEIRNVGNNSFTLDDIVRRGETKGTVELVFEIDGADYTIEWELYTTSTPNGATLASPALSETISGIGNVQREIQRLLGMDEDDFASSVYVKQGEIDRLIEASDRASMIDGLLGLDEIDDYIQTMKMARRGAGRVQDRNSENADSRRGEVQENFERDEDDFEDEIAELDGEIDDIEAQIVDIEEFLDELRDARADLEGKIEDYESVVEQKREKEEQIEEVERKRTERHQQIEDCESRIEEHEANIVGLEDEIDELAGEVASDVDTSEAAGDALDEVRGDLKSASVEQADHKNDLERAEDELSSLEEELDDARSALSEHRSKREDIETEIENYEEILQSAEEDLEDAIQQRNEMAVTFVSTIDSSEEVDDETIEDVEEHLTALDDQHGEIEKKVTKRKTTLDERESDLEDERAELTEAQTALEEKREELEVLSSEVTDAESRVETLTDEFETRFSSLTERASDHGVELSEGELESAANQRLADRLEEVNQDLDEVGNQISALDEREDSLQSDLQEIRELQEESKCPRCRQPVDETHIEGEVEGIESEIEATRNEREEQREEREELEEQRDSIRDLQDGVLDLAGFQRQEVETAADELEELRDQTAELESEVDDLEAEVESHEEEIENLEDEIAGLQEEIQRLRSERDEAEAAIETGERLVNQFETVEEHRERVDDVQLVLDDLQTDLEEVDDSIDEAGEELESFESAIEEQEEVIEERQEALEEVNQRVAALEEQEETLERVTGLYEEIEDEQSQISDREQSIEAHHEMISTLNEQLTDLQNARDDLAERLGDTDLGELEDKLEQVEERIEQRKENRNELQEQVQGVRDHQTKLKNELSNLRELKERIDEFERKAQWAKAVHDELDTTINIYEDVKSELREKYLAYINEYTNDIFRDIYLNSCYQRVLVTETYNERSDSYDYDIQLERDDGTTEDPSNASGGERAIVNLALRAGIYKLIAELEGGDRGRLPPFILDEPTTFLDDGHVGQLEEMLDRIRDWDVPQVIVVSHDEALIHGADHECRVEMDDATNTSRVVMRSAGAD